MVDRRNAGLYGGLGGAASVLYPNMDEMTTVAGYYSDKNSANHLASFEGEGVPETGTVKITEGGEVSADIVRGSAAAPDMEPSKAGAMAD